MIKERQERGINTQNTTNKEKENGGGEAKGNYGKARQEIYTHMHTQTTGGRNTTQI